MFNQVLEAAVRKIKHMVEAQLLAYGNDEIIIAGTVPELAGGLEEFLMEAGDLGLEIDEKI